ncbi:MAG: tetratricopeptide repeat protein [Candidatus Desantisbacteria bacterium]
MAEKSGAVTDTLGWIYYQRGEYDKALEALKEARNLEPNDPMITYHLGLAYLKNKMKPEGKKEILEALKNPNFPEAEEAKKMIKELK